MATNTLKASSDGEPQVRWSAWFCGWLVRGDYKLPKGEFLGVLDWRDASGQVRRWMVRQGPRANNIIVEAQNKHIVCGWDHLTSRLRRHRSIPKRIFA